MQKTLKGGSGRAGGSQGGFALQVRSVLIVSVALLALAAPALGLHSANNGVNTTDTGVRSFNVPLLANAVWWSHSSVAGVPTGLNSQTHSFELNIPQGRQVIVTAETFPTNTPDTPKVCIADPADPVNDPVFVSPLPGTAIVHGVSCVKENGYSVQIHYFPWETGANDPDHVVSITPATPLATTQWRVDAVPLSYKAAIIPAGHWTIWIDPAVAIHEYRIEYRAYSTTGPFYFDYLGTRGCPFHTSELAAGLTDSTLLGCPNNFV